MDKKVVWLINEYAGTPYHGMGMRHFFLAKKLIDKGHKAFVISAAYSHLLTKLPQVDGEFNLEKIDDVNFLWIKVPYYSHAHSKKRVYKWLYFAYKVYSILSRSVIDKPDIVLSSSPAPFHTVSAYKLSRKFGAKYFFEVRDIWPLTLIEVGGYSANHPFMKFMEWFEKYGYKKADKVISLLPLAYEHMIKQGMPKGKFVHIPNGICLDYMQEAEPLDEQTLKLIPKDKFLVAYTGTIGKANALEYLIEAAKILQDRNYTDIAILIVGKGMEKENMINLAQKLGLKNVIFIPPIKKLQVISLLKLVDVAYIGWRKLRLYHYGVSANKLFDYMIAKKPIIHSYSGGGDIVKLANAGYTVPAESSLAIAEAIIKLFNLSKDERRKLGENGYNYVLENHTFEKLAQKLETLF